MFETALTRWTTTAFKAVVEDEVWKKAGDDFFVWKFDLEDVKDQLQGVVQIQRTDAAFAAILGKDGRVIAWGNSSMLDRKDWGYYCIYIFTLQT